MTVKKVLLPRKLLFFVCFATSFTLVSTQKLKKRIEELDGKLEQCTSELEKITLIDQLVAETNTLRKRNEELEGKLEQCTSELEKLTFIDELVAENNSLKERLASEDQSELEKIRAAMSELATTKHQFKPFENRDELIRAVDAYVGQDLNAKAAIQVIYGPFIAFWDVSMLTSFASVFDGCALNRNNDNLKTFNEDLSGWDVSQATSMVKMFHCGHAFNQPLSSWDVSSVSTMEAMFWYASDLNQPLSSWNVSTVSTMAGMFSWASNFNQPLSSWDVSRVSNMMQMFQECTSYNQDLSGWTIGNDTDTSYMFLNAPLMDSSKKPSGVE